VNRDAYFAMNIDMELLCFCFVAYCVVADESAGRQLPMAFLERIKDDFVSKYGGGKATTSAANSLNKEFGYFNSILTTNINFSISPFHYFYY
jgi:hypothetical protein